MQCRLWSFVFCAASMLTLAGCMAHKLETRLISSFIDKLEKSDIEHLKEVSSTDFKGSALRHGKAVEAFKMLNLPEGKVTVIEVKEKSEDEKRVLVKVGEKGKERKLYFDLLLDPQTKKWVVHDVEFKKNLKPGQVNKSVTEQMDLLLSIQEFLDSWESGDRQQILASSTADLRKSLEPLPEKSLKQFTAKIMTGLNRDSVKPEVEGHANTALVRIKRKGGEMLVTLRMENDKWVADDIGVQSRKEDGAVPSLRKQTQVLLTSIRFCEAYQSGNKQEMAKYTDPLFFRRTLEAADLSKIPLPVKRPEEEDFDIKMLSTRAEVLVKREDQIIHLSLSQGPPKRDDEGNPIESDAETGRPFLIEEITFHEIATNQDKRISAMLSSQSLVQVFAKALVEGDLKSLRFESTADFQNRVWSRIELEDLADLPLEQIESAPPVVIDTAFKGPLTEVTVNQGSTPLTYVLRDQNGRVLVDDVLVPALDRPNSLKMNLEVQIPLRNFAKGLRTGDMRLVRDHASREFNKMVFQSMNRLPQLRSDPAPYLMSNVNRIQLKTDRALLVLGDEQYGAKVFMEKQGEHYVIDDIIMISGQLQSQRTGLRLMLREMVLKGTRFTNSMAKNPKLPNSLDENQESMPVVLGSEAAAAEEGATDPRSSSKSRIQQTSHSKVSGASYRSDRSYDRGVQNYRKLDDQEEMIQTADYQEEAAGAGVPESTRSRAPESDDSSAPQFPGRSIKPKRPEGKPLRQLRTNPDTHMDLDSESNSALPDASDDDRSPHEDDVDVIQPPR